MLSRSNKMQSRRSILITGAAGFLGSHAAEYFRNAGWEVVCVDRKNPTESKQPPGDESSRYLQNDLTSVESVIAVLDRHRPKVCIHFAGAASVLASFEDPLADFTAQTLPLMGILEAIRLSGIQTRVLLPSSAAVYGNPEAFPVSEQERIKPISPYGFHKYHQEMLLSQYQSLYGLDVCRARIFSTFGPGLTRLAVWDIARRALKGDYSIYGSGEQTRDYLFVTDVASALLCIVEKASFSGEAINVGSGEETPIIKLAEKIYSELGIDVKPRLQHEQEITGNPMRWRADVSRLCALGFEREVSLDAGIRSTVEWIKANS